MRPGASRLYLAAALALAASGAFSPVLSAPRAGAGVGARPAFVGQSGRLISRPPVGPRPGTYSAQAGFGVLPGERFGAIDAFFRRRGDFRRFGRFGRYGPGFGAFYGLPYGADCDCGGGAYDGEAMAGEPKSVGKPEWPTTIGIPPSPVAPPALYVIGSERRNASVSRRRSAQVSIRNGIQASGATSGRLASGPMFIQVPSGR
jgi:hypothetical protein